MSGPVGKAHPHYSEVLSKLIDEVVRPAAAWTDQLAEFPRRSIDALAEAGFLGFISSPDVGGAGEGMAAAADVVERLAGVCGSTAMILLMHYAAVVVLEAHGPRDVRERIGEGQHLTTLAFSETGSRSHFWAPLGTAAQAGLGIRLDAQKSWVTSAGEADSYVWSSRPLRAEGPMTLWLVRAELPGLTTKGGFDGLGLRGNSSSPVLAENVLVPKSAMLGEDGAGLDFALSTVLPWFLVLNSAFSLGIAETVTARTGEHLTHTRLAHLEGTLAEQPATRLAYARMRLRTDEVRAFLETTLGAVSEGIPEATLRLLEVKAVAAEGAAEVADQAMRLCGGSAFRRGFGVERHFRDCLAARVMAPTTDALLDFVGRVACGLPLFDPAMEAKL